MSVNLIINKNNISYSVTSFSDASENFSFEKVNALIKNKENPFPSLNNVSGNPISGPDGIIGIVGENLIKWSDTWKATEEQKKSGFTLRLKALMKDFNNLLPQPIEEVVVRGEQAAYFDKKMIDPQLGLNCQYYTASEFEQHLEDMVKDLVEKDPSSNLDLFEKREKYGKVVHKCLVAQQPSLAAKVGKLMPVVSGGLALVEVVKGFVEKEELEQAFKVAKKITATVSRKEALNILQKKCVERNHRKLLKKIAKALQ